MLATEAGAWRGEAVLAEAVRSTLDTLELPSPAWRAWLRDTPVNATELIAFVCILCPLGLYRGPFNLLGLGAGLAASMLAVGVLPVTALSAVFYAAFRWPTQSCRARSAAFACRPCYKRRR